MKNTNRERPHRPNDPASEDDVKPEYTIANITLFDMNSEEIHSRIEAPGAFKRKNGKKIRYRIRRVD